MSQELQKSASSDKKLKVTVVIMAVVALFAPAHAQVSEWGSSVIAMTWVLYISEWDTWFMFHPFMLLNSLPFTFLRPVFIYMFYRLYLGKSTKKRVLVVGIISEIMIEVLFYISMIMMMLLSPWGWFSLQLLFPIPLLFMIGLLYMKLYPPPEVTSWVDESEPSYWWTEKKEEKQDKKSETIQDKKSEERITEKTERKPEEIPEKSVEEEPEDSDSDIWMD